jgi:hypothetical protein
MQTSMPGLGAVLRHCLIALGLLAMAACAPATVALNYVPPTNLSPVAGAKPAVAVGSFTDNRGLESRFIGRIRGGYGNSLKTLSTEAPVVNVVAKAFAEGLAARGIAAPAGAARYTITGVINKLDCNYYVREEAHTNITLVVTETATGKAVMTQPFLSDLRSDFGARDFQFDAVAEALRVLTEKTLRNTVDAALDSPAFRQAVQL